MRSLTPLALLCVSVLGCQSYDFEPLVPVTYSQTTQHSVAGLRFRPNMMLLIDRSGSMDTPIDAADPRCTAGCGSANPCPAACPTRMSEVKSAMNQFLTEHGDRARFGLTAFPSGKACDAATQTLVPLSSADDDATVAADALTVNAVLQDANFSAGGGTPTAASLTFVGRNAALTDERRANLVVLLTDGLPNCNAQNANNSCTAINNACRCTQNSCTGQNCSLGCLDQDATVAAVADLKSKGIQTLVIGFGTDTLAGDAPLVLNAMAEAGGFARGCRDGTDIECGPGDRCDLSSRLCQRRFFQASNAADLLTILPVPPTGCDYLLQETPSRPEFLSVSVGGKTVGRDGWKLNGNTLTLLGAPCDQVRFATPAKPVDVEFRIVQQL